MDPDTFPELENDVPRIRIVISMLEEFPSVRANVEQWLKSEFAEEMK